MARRPLDFTEFRKQLDLRLRDPATLLDWLLEHGPLLIGPSITDFAPRFGPPGTMLTITGRNFSETRLDNHVEVGGESAFVVSATANRLVVMTGSGIVDGPVKVEVGGRSAAGPVDFDVTGIPNAGAGEDGPPISFSGAGNGQAGDVDPIGTVRVLVVLVCPNDRVPANPATTRATVQTAWNNVVTYYDQASYGKTDVQIDMTANWRTLDGSRDDFIDDGISNIEWAQMDRVTAQAAQAAVDEGFDLDNYAMIAVVMNLDGAFIRAWGGWSLQNFSYSNGAGININLTADHAINMLAIQESANWGRCAHEFGHNVVSAPGFAGDGSATLGEDIYSSDLVDPAAATAAPFDLMGSHDSHPLFSGYHLDKLGYYDAANILALDWTRNPFSGEFDVVAHGLNQDGVNGRYHLIRIRIAEGLNYYVQVRQRPGATTQIFDDSIPLGGAPNQGGVIVTAAIADTLNTNQQTRFITLLHDQAVLEAGEFVDDPARALRITVVNAAVSTNPLVCRVRVEWAQTIADDPNGSFDLRITPWDSDWQSPDIWIDRAPFGTFDNGNDAEGRPTGNGDRPRPLEVNRFIGRVHVSGAMGASDVKVTFYAVFPPGVGDNGNWAPIGSQTIPAIAANGFVDVQQNWVPVLGEHTCLQVHASGQFGEISSGNNFAQENVFDFEAPSASPADPVRLSVAIRNPLDEKRIVRLIVKGVPTGWHAHFPHSWVWLDAKSERRFDLTVIPTQDWVVYAERKLPMTAPIKVEGILARAYDTPLGPFDEPAGSRAYPIGGILSRVHVRKRSAAKLAEDRRRSTDTVIAVSGGVAPSEAGQRVRVTLADPKGRERMVEVMTDASGRFAAAFDLNFEPSLEASRRRWRKADEVLRGKYRAQAFIIASDRLAEGESNAVTIER